MHRVEFGFVVSSLRLGGAEKVTLTVAYELAKRGHKVKILSLSNFRELTVPAHQNLTLKVSPIRRTIFMPFFLYSEVRKSSIKCLICNFWILGLSAGLVRLVCPSLRVYIWEHGYSNRSADNFDFFSPILSKLINGVIVVSRKMSDYCKMRYTDKVRLHLIYNPIDRVRLSKTDCLTQNKVVDGQKLVVCISRLVARKGIETLLAAWCSVRAYADVCLYIIGNGDMETSFKKLAVELELSESVVFTGLLDNPSKLIAQSVLLVLPSETEGFGLPVLEALVIGTPVVATRCGSIMEELLPLENCGQLVPINDVKALSNAILLELELNRRVTLSDNTLALFSSENAAEKIEQLA